MASQEAINFDIIEGQKENIQALPSGRSAKKLAQLFSPSPLQQQATPPSEAKTINDAIRAEYEAEIEALAESDDPLDVYDRYVRWTLDAYPSAQATPQSQLHTVLERATKTFVNSPQYKNDPRYVKLWLLYIQFFSDAPRETFVFLSRHAIGETLALFYEEYAAWLEGAGRWSQAEEVYKLGIEREARPTSRLLRKFGEFEQRRAAQGDAAGPSSPALPVVRKALGAKIDPFAAAAAARDPQAPRQTSAVGGGGGGGQASKPKSKLAIFSDADAPAPAPALSSMGAGSKGWDSIGSLSDRRKENVMEAKPWAGETLKAGGKKSSAPKMAIFRDQSLKKQLSQSHIAIHHSKLQVTVNPVSGKKERVFVDLRAIYPTPDEPGTELSFEEIWAANRGWLDCEWEPETPKMRRQHRVSPQQHDENALPDVDLLADNVSKKLLVHHDVLRLDENGAPIYPHKETTKPKKKKVAEVNETQIIKAKLDSPSGPKIKKRRQSTAEPTMTLHTKAATDDIYDIFNAPVKPVPTGISDDENGDEDSDDYDSADESNMTTTRNITTSEAGDDDEEDDAAEEERDDEETTDVKSVSEWSEFSTGKHIPGLNGAEDDDRQNETQMSDLIDVHDHAEGGDENDHQDEDNFAPRTRTVFVPIPPEDYVPTKRPYRDPVEMANNRLPFMTPITERTESSLDITLHAKSPSKRTRLSTTSEYGEEEEDEEDGYQRSGSELESLSSPLQEIIEDKYVLSPQGKPFAQPRIEKPKPLGLKSTGTALAPKGGPIIKDVQCNPVSNDVRSEILSKMQPPLSSYPGFYDHRNERFGAGSEIRKYVKALTKGSRNSTDKRGSLNSAASSPVLQFPGTGDRRYTIKKELGAGAFAPVYLIENSSPDSDADDEHHQQHDENSPVARMGKGAFASGTAYRRREREALKMEDPPTPWEFYMMRLSHTRLGPLERATASLSPALEMHLYQDEGFLILPFHPHGSLLDVVNLFRAEPSGVMDEQLAMFFTIELLRTVEALHARGLMHGDLKVDNCLLRLDSSQQLTSQYHPDGSGGWSSRGVTLIDFGRAIDMRAFVPEVQFVADWKTTAQDCAEMREGRPWTWQIDYHGLAGIVHCLLLGKYIETVGVRDGLSKRYKIRESLKRYWQTAIWGECFDVLLNPGMFVEREEGGRMPVLKGLRGVRERMEGWLEVNCEKGVGLRSLVGRVEAWSRGRK